MVDKPVNMSPKEMKEDLYRRAKEYAHHVIKLREEIPDLEKKVATTKKAADSANKAASKAKEKLKETYEALNASECKAYDMYGDAFGEIQDLVENAMV